MATTTRPKRFKAALIDISGTILVGKEPIPGAIDACKKLFQHGLQVIFLTNTSKISAATLLNQLRSAGFDESAIPNDGAIMTSVSATRQFCLRNNLRPYCLVEDELIDQDFVGVEMHDPNCVLVGLAPTKFCYESLNGAFRLLLRLKKSRQEEDLENDNVEHCKVDDTTAQGAAASTNQYIKCNNQHPLLVAIHQATRFRENDREFSLGPGGFVSLLEQTAGVSAHVVGKPSVNFYHAAVSSLQLDYLSEVVMVGDDVVGDIQGLGAAVLVKTGKYVQGDELCLETGRLVPTLTVNSIVDAVDYICSNADGA